METMNFQIAQPEVFPLPLMRASGPDDDVKTVVTPEDEPAFDEATGPDAPEDGAEKESVPAN